MTSTGRISHRQIAIIGAGPYGLALAAKLQTAGADYVAFGRAMSFWENNVPRGTLLLHNSKSWSFLNEEFGIAAYERTLGAGRLRIPLPAEDFIAYGRWFHRATGTDPDRRVVVRLTRIDGRYAIRLEDGHELTSERVVIAIGLKSFAFVPRQFNGLPRALAMHTSELYDLDSFSRKTIAVVGRGQAALECAALLAEAKADVEVVTPSAELRWRSGIVPEGPAGQRSSLRTGLRRRLIDPDVFRRLPALGRMAFLKHSMRSWASLDLMPRLASVRFSFKQRVTSAHVANGRVELQFDDGYSRTVDHVVFGTGYRVAVSAIPFLDGELRSQIKHHSGYPKLNKWMESTSPGMYFTGAAAAASFGPNLNFIFAVPWATERIAKALLGGPHAATNVCNTYRAAAVELDGFGRGPHSHAPVSTSLSTGPHLNQKAL